MYLFSVLLFTLSPTLLYAHDLDGEWCVDEGNRVQLFEQPGGGDAGSDISNTAIGCGLIKVLLESKDKTGGVAKFIANYKREKKNAPSVITHVNYDAETVTNRMVGLINFMKMHDNAYYLSYTDISDSNRSGFAYVNGNTMRRLTSVQSQNYDTLQGRVIYTSSTRKSKAVPVNFLETWDALYASSQKRQAKIIK